MNAYLIVPFVIVCSGIALLAYFTASRQQGPFAYVLRKLGVANQSFHIRIGRSLYAVAAATALFCVGALLWPSVVLPLALWFGILLPFLGMVFQSLPVHAVK